MKKRREPGSNTAWSPAVLYSIFKEDVKMRTIHKTFGAALFLAAFAAFIVGFTGDTAYGAANEGQREEFAYGGYTYGVEDAIGTYSIGKDNAGDLKAYEFAIRGREENGHILFLDGRGDMKDMESGEKSPWRDSIDKIRDLVVADDRITSIGSGAFHGCGSLEKAIFGNGIKEIENFAFEGTALQEIEIPESLRVIGKAAFGGCMKLESITIPSGVASVREEAFLNCTSLTDIHVKGELTKFQDSVFLVQAPYSKESPLATTLDTENRELLAPDYWKYQNRSTNICTIRFVDYDGTELEGEQHVLKGKSFRAPKGNPERESDVQYSYVFTGWEPQLSDSLVADSDQTFRAQYRQEVRKYEVRFYDRHGELRATNAAYGQVPEDPQFPVEERDGGVVYIRSGWCHVYRDADGTEQSEKVQELQSVSGPGEYYYAWSEVELLCEVSFLDWDGTEIAKAFYRQGETIAIPQDPQREGSPQTDYNFSGWEPQVQAQCSGEAVYRASYTETARTYTARFLDMDGSIIKEEVFHYGDGITPPPAPEHEGMEFTGWVQVAPEIVIGDFDMMATYRKVQTGSADDSESGVSTGEGGSESGTPATGEDGSESGASAAGEDGSESGASAGEGGSESGAPAEGGGSGNGASDGEGGSETGTSEGENGSENGTSAGEGVPENGASESGNNSGNNPSEGGGNLGSDVFEGGDNSGNSASEGGGNSGNGASEGSGNSGSNAFGEGNGSESGVPDSGNSSGSSQSSEGGSSGSNADGGNNSDDGTERGLSDETSSSGTGSNPVSGNSQSSGNSGQSSGNNSASNGNSSQSSGNNGSSGGNGNPSSGNSSLPGAGNSQSNGNSTASSGRGNHSTPLNGGNSGITNEKGKQDSGAASGSAIGNSQGDTPDGSPISEGSGSQKTERPSTGKETEVDIGDGSPVTKDSGNSEKNGKEQGHGEKTKDNEGKDSGTKDKGKPTENETGDKNGSSKKQSGTGNKAKTGTESSPTNKRATNTDKSALDGNTASVKNISSINSSGKNSATWNPGSWSVVSGSVDGRTTANSSTSGRQWKLTDTPSTKAGQGEAMQDIGSHTDRESGQGGTDPFVISVPADSLQDYADAGNGASTGKTMEDSQITKEEKQATVGSETENHSIPLVFIFLGTLLVAFSCLVLAFFSRRKRKSRDGK